jgi:hypothetical protein
MAETVWISMPSGLQMTGAWPQHLGGRFGYAAIEHLAKLDIRPATQAGVRPVVLVWRMQRRGLS